LYLYIAAAI
jgi:ribonuclease HI